MPKRSTPKRDFMQVAREVVERSIGEKMDGSPLVQNEQTPRAKAGRIGGLKGGKARAQGLTAEQRRQIARKAAQARWKPRKAD